MQLRTVSKGLSTTLVAGRILTTPHLQKIILRDVNKVLGLGRILWARSHEIRLSKISRFVTDVFSLRYIRLQWSWIQRDWSPVLDSVSYYCVYMCRRNILPTCRSRNHHDTSKCELLPLVTNIHLTKNLLEEELVKNDVRKKFVCGTC